MMRLESVVFPTSKFYRYRRMADVLKLSVAENSPDTPVSIHCGDNRDDDVQRQARPKCSRTWVENARKAKHHSQIIRAAASGELLCMIDADTMVLRPLGELEDQDFDLAYTVRPAGSDWRMNSGVYFVRISEAVKSFCDQWEQVCMRMLADEQLHYEWREQHRYGGVHQAAFGYMLREASGVKIIELPCTEWNCVNGCWSTAADPRIVHVMGALRDCCFRKTRASGPAMLRLVERWRAYDNRAEAARLAG